MSDYRAMVIINLQKELDQLEYAGRLRRRQNQCIDHIARITTNCHGCRAEFWIKKLQELDIKKEEAQPTIGLSNSVKSEAGRTQTGETQVKQEAQ